MRKQISPAYRQEAALEAAKIFMSQDVIKASQHIACYLATPHEFDTYALIESIWAAHKNCYLPILINNKELQFVCYEHGDPLSFNQYKILEPIKREQIISVQQLDVVITPLLAFDKAGNRLGMGGGYYDRTFASLLPNQYPFLLGLGFAAQEIPTLSADPWDIQLQAVLTEKALIWCQSER